MLTYQWLPAATPTASIFKIGEHCQNIQIHKLTSDCIYNCDETGISVLLKKIRNNRQKEVANNLNRGFSRNRRSRLSYRLVSL